MKTLTSRELQKLVDAGNVIEKDAYGPKVVILAPDRYLKIFYHKTSVSMARLRSRAQQFASNAAKLKKRGITTVGILEVFSVPAESGQLRRDCVCYHGIPGDTVRSVLQSAPKDPELSRQLGAYIAELHNAGVMFRSLHFGNIIQLGNIQQRNHQPDKGRFGLIDIADMRVNVFTLNRWQRKRNFQHVFRYQKDLALVDMEAFCCGYLASNGGSDSEDRFLSQAIAAASPVRET